MNIFDLVLWGFNVPIQHSKVLVDSDNKTEITSSIKARMESDIQKKCQVFPTIVRLYKILNKKYFSGIDKTAISHHIRQSIDKQQFYFYQHPTTALKIVMGFQFLISISCAGSQLRYDELGFGHSTIPMRKTPIKVNPSSVIKYGLSDAHHILLGGSSIPPEKRSSTV
ncbi:hypothetical protein WA026_022337 [Henosepilachna vigintioctopunctata]|uniref:Uncharacterized protein n=1 Tax=Henosepilachna vigintioctopunctata TaxID=420089 RepID=A0AAW1V5K2_9CUCU